MKKILGLDLGTTSVGWAYVHESENQNDSRIVKVGVRVNPLTTDEQTNFEKGKPITINADRTLKRGARRTLDRYKLRRKNLIETLAKANLISTESKLTEDGKNTTFETLYLRSKAVNSKINKEELARVFLTMNKKRGYKSSRKSKNTEDGQAIDGMAVAKRLYDENLTPGQFAYHLLKEGKKVLPDFYRSDLQSEFDAVWNFQRKFYPEILTDEFYKELQGKGQKATSALFWVKYQFNTAENKAKSREEKKLLAYKWRNDAINQQLTKEEIAFVLTEINNDLKNSSGYLGAISDRSKELYFNKLTVGQYLYKQVKNNPHAKLKNQVFYRQDYLDEFEAIWNEQKKHHPELTNDLKADIRDITIFYQRKLKSQKSLISFCEFESREILLENGTKRTIGLRVAPKSSPLFQEFKIWQRLNDVVLRKKGSRKSTSKTIKTQTAMFEEEKTEFYFDFETKQNIFQELSIKGNLTSSRIIELLGHKSSEWEMNFSELEGNKTSQALYNAYLKILEVEGYNEDLLKLIDKDDINITELKTPANEIKEMVQTIFKSLGIDTTILEFDAELEGRAFEQQASYRLWHLLYSAEDDSKSYSEEDKLTYGNENIGLKKLLCQKFGFKPEHAKILANVSFVDDYGSLSSKAIRKIYPYIKENNYSAACVLAGYRHSASSLTKDEIAKRQLKDKLELLRKNSLRNPVVEKILNQVVNLVNTLIEENTEKDEKGKITNYFKFDEIRIELARDLKKNAKERAEMTSNINSAKINHEKIFKLLQAEFGVKNPTKNDIIRYRLYDELKNNGYKDLYTNTYIPREILFSKQIDIEHIIPQSKLFDDSFSNKTITYRKDNLDKGNKTAFDYIESKFGETALEEYTQRVENLFELGKKSKDDLSAGISKAKYKKLLMKESDIGDGFIERDLRDSQYIAKKAKNMLFEISRSVVSTTGSVTDKLREDWDLINIMQEINFEKFKQLGLTEMVEKKDGSFKERIVDWSKRNDHRHHAMDALTVAFTKHNHIQYLNYLNARKNEKHKMHGNIIAIETLETELVTDSDGNRKRSFKLPIPNFRQIAKEHLESILVSHKAKNKVVTKNKNRVKTKNGEKVKVELTPRGQLHKETVYGKYKFHVNKEEKVSAKFNEVTINKVTNPTYRNLLLKRLQENGNDPKKAFTGKNSLDKTPIYIDAELTEKVPESVNLTWLEEDYSIRKDVTPENFKDAKTIEKVIDNKVRKILLERLSKYGDSKKAFSDLDKNPIWLNKEKGISIKRVTISGVKNAESLHFKKDHFGNEILDKDGKRIPVDFVSTGNNHHVAIYSDDKGNLQERVVSLFDAVQLVNAGEPIIDKTYNQGIGWQFLFTMKQNEYFVFPNDKTGFNPKEIDLLDAKNKKKISPNLFRVQKISTKNYVFNNHLETKAIDSEILKNKKQLSGIMYYFIQTPSNLENIIKVQLNHLGDIVQVGEY
jgi:CRISPR-associated endonuclease Csn1